MYVLGGNVKIGRVSASAVSRLLQTDGVLSSENVNVACGYTNGKQWHEVGGVKWFNGLVHSIKGRIDPEIQKQVVKLEGIHARLTFPLNEIVMYELVLDDGKMFVIGDHVLRNEKNELLVEFGLMKEVVYENMLFFDTRGKKIM
jgi:hypothetical protein